MSAAESTVSATAVSATAVSATAVSAATPGIDSGIRTFVERVYYDIVSQVSRSLHICRREHILGWMPRAVVPARKASRPAPFSPSRRTFIFAAQEVSR
ncbi:hypothetical protein PMIN05_012570 [Paraphaeosphaeria minitans]